MVKHEPTRLLHWDLLTILLYKVGFPPERIIKPNVGSASSPKESTNFAFYLLTSHVFFFFFKEESRDALKNSAENQMRAND